MSTDLKQLERDIKRRLRTASTGRSLKQRLDWKEPYPVGLRLTALVLLQVGDWGGLAVAARRYRRDADRGLKAIAKQQEEWSALWRDAETMRGLLKASWRSPGREPNWPSIRSRIEQMLRENGLPAAEAKAQANALATGTAQDVMQAVDTPLGWWAGELSIAATLRLSALAAADIGDAVAGFNGRLASVPRAPEVSAVRDATTELMGALRALHAALRTGTLSAVRTSVRHAEIRAEELMAPLLDAAGYWNRRQQGGNAVAGPRGLAAADAIRLALFVRSVARLLGWITSYPEASASFDEWRKVAKSRPFASKYKFPTPTPINDIIRDVSRYDGKYIAIKGTVGPVAISHARRKVVSSASVSDADGTAVRIGLPHIKLDSGGLVMGSYALVAGTFSTRNEDFDTAVLVLDRRNLTEDAARSWLDWLTLELLPIVTPVPHQLCATWTWSGGADGPGNLLRYGTWAANSRGSII